MGDTSIYLLIDSTLVNGGAAATAPSSSSFHFQTLSHVIPADASLSELMDYISSRIEVPINVSAPNGQTKRGEWLDKITILDISYHPAKIISSICKKFSELTGPNSKTLQSLGWYPSGKLAIFPSPPPTSGDDMKNAEEAILNRFVEWQSRNAMQHEDFTYNNPEAAAKCGNSFMGDGPAARSTEDVDGGGVQWTGVGTSAQGNTATMKPSEIFNAVEQRSVKEPEIDPKSTKKKKPRRTEKERTQRLDALLQNLDAKSGQKKKKKAVSEKVRTMLLKSRSEGNKKMRMEDRFHLEVLRLWDVAGEDDMSKHSNNTTEYRFFSRQTTAGRVASSVAPNLGNAKASEFLVLYPSPSADNAQQQQQQEHEKRYRRLPNTMSLHDAQAAGWVKEFGVVVVRIYSLVGGVDGEEFGPSKSVLYTDSDDEKGAEKEEHD